VSLDYFLDKLDNVRRGYGSFMARCPAHEDKKQSLSIYPVGDGFSFHCHAGCTWSEILRALSEGELPAPTRAEDARPHSAAWVARGGQTPSLSESAPRPAELGDFEHVYYYEDEVGALQFAVCRSSDKRFFQARFSFGSPTFYYWGLNGARKVPYRLPRVIEAVKSGETVYIVEGEKDVHSVEKAGKTATCPPGGAGKWRPEYNQHFEEAYVIIVADRDKAGRAHANDIKANLLHHARFVTVVEPVVGKDVTDHLDAGMELEHLAL